MDQVDVEAAIAYPALGEIPSQLITITDGGEKYFYWYVKVNPACREFDKPTQMALARLMHAKGIAMAVGQLEGFHVQGGDYFLSKRGDYEFVIEALN